MALRLAPPPASVVTVPGTHAGRVPAGLGGGVDVAEMPAAVRDADGDTEAESPGSGVDVAGMPAAVRDADGDTEAESPGVSDGGRLGLVVGEGGVLAAQSVRQAAGGAPPKKPRVKESSLT